MPDIMDPVWKGKVAYRESFLPLEKADGNIEPVALLYPAVKVFEVLSASLQIRYEEGKDYILADGRLEIPDGSRIPRMSESEYYPESPLPNQSFGRTGGGNLRFSEGSFFHNLQTVVTYSHKGTWPGEIPEDKSELLPQLKERLSAGAPIRIVFFGDSITVGGNSSNFIGVPPFQPDWCEQFARELECKTGSTIDSIRTAVGGTSSNWGVETADERAAVYQPDLVVLAFGMNDGNKEAEEHAANIQRIIDTVRNRNSKCEFLVIATMLPNIEAEGFYCKQIYYAPELLKMEKKGIAVCNMTSIHGTLLSRKNYRDMTGNNINHPNDYLSRVYAQALLATVGIQ